MNVFRFTATPTPQPTGVLSDETLNQISEQWARIQVWAQGMLDQLTSQSGLWQAGIILCAIAAGYGLAIYPKQRFEKLRGDLERPILLRRLYRSLGAVSWPIASLILLWIGATVFNAMDMRNDALRISASLLSAWVVVRLATTNMKQGVWLRILSVGAWTIAALYITHLLGPVVSWMRGASVSLGNWNLSFFELFSGLAVALFAFWIGGLAGNVAQSRLRSSKSLNPSIAGLLGQVLKIAFLVAAAVISIQSLGVDLTALAVFSGALGVGVGFGLQSVFSNFISGVILLFEGAIKVGDFIELQSGVTGLVKEINIRSTLITTNDNVDILIPNEEFIKGQVINWTHRETLRRTHIGFGVAYGTDKEKVKTAALEAAAEVEWTYTRQADRSPQVWLVNFGDSSLDFELVVWLTEDGVKRPARVKADYLWALHSKLEKYGIEIPFPQQDLHIKGDSAPLRIMDAADAPPPEKPKADTAPLPDQGDQEITEV